MMFKGAGIEVYDLGTDVTAEAFANKAEEVGAQIVCLSALLTTTMPAMKEIIDEFTKRGIREKYIFMIGGAPITTNYAKEIGADHYTADAATASEVAKSLLVS
ncbi:cobalamin-dependent protein [Clostridium estertheticum]|uniref:cobalamin B12-binding domain-containing protein n=1 Tax=Clostridium estertheticum TaxID=238834 RepID=UPI0013E8F840|nr:cobalamin-dependent protein [Clostridium estertheticum]MBZ9685985.1 cobalamin-dependent protein [Clostridium estertheticum]